MTNTLTQTSSKPRNRNEAFIQFVRKRIRQDNGLRARLRRSLRSDDEITSDALWLLGDWLPNDQDQALMMARIAAWCATYHSKSTSDLSEHNTNHWIQTVAGQLGHSQSKITEQTAQRILESFTRDGMSTVERLNHITRALEVCPFPELVNWSKLIFDLTDLSAGGQKARAVRIRWYRAYHRLSNSRDTNS